MNKMLICGVLTQTLYNFYNYSSKRLSREEKQNNGKMLFFWIYGCQNWRGNLIQINPVDIDNGWIYQLGFNIFSISVSVWQEFLQFFIWSTIQLSLPIAAITHSAFNFQMWHNILTFCDFSLTVLFTALLILTVNSESFYFRTRLDYYSDSIIIVESVEPQQCSIQYYYIIIINPYCQ